MEVLQLKINLPVTFIEDGDAVVAYTPALDLSTAGDDKEDAKRMFAEAVDIFFEDLIAHNTLDEVLTELGWSKSIETGWQPPHISQEAIKMAVIESTRKRGCGDQLSCRRESVCRYMSY